MTVADDYMPTTEQIREFIEAADRVVSSFAPGSAATAFDRWLAGVVAEKRTEWEAARLAEQGEVEWGWQWCYVEKWADGSGVYERVTFDTLKKARRYLRDNAEHLDALNAQATQDDRVVASIEKRRVTEPGAWVPVNEEGSDQP